MYPFFYLYITIFLLFVVESRLSDPKKKRRVGVMGLVIVFLFIGLRSENVGTDTPAYVGFFHDPNFHLLGEPTDFMFSCLGRFFHLFNDTTEYFLLASSFVMCFGLFFLIYKLCGNVNFGLLLFCLVGTSSINLFLYMSMMRQACALTFFFIAAYLFFTYGKAKLKTSLALYILAIMTHGSIVFTLPFVLIIWKFGIPKKWWMLLIAATYVMAASRVIDINKLLNLAFSIAGGLTTRDYSFYADVSFGMIEQKGFFNMDILPFTLWSLFLCWFSKEKDLGCWHVKFFLMSVVLNNVFSDNLMWARLILPFSLMAIIAIPYLTAKLDKKLTVPFYIVFFAYYIYKTVNQLIFMSSPFATGNIVVPYETWLFN